jgi:hypothetical protein
MLHKIQNPHQPSNHQLIDHKRYLVTGINQYTGSPTDTNIYFYDPTVYVATDENKFPLGHMLILEGVINFVTDSNATCVTVPFVAYICRDYKITGVYPFAAAFSLGTQFPVRAMPASTSLTIDPTTGQLSLRLSAAYAGLDTAASFISFIVRSTTPIDYLSGL